MDDSMEEGDSLFSLPGPSTRPRALYQTPPQSTSGPPPPIGLGYNSSIVPQHLPNADESFDQSNRWNGGASPPGGSSTSQDNYEDENDENDESNAINGDQVEGEEDSYEASEGSSAQYDPDADPEGFAQRLDELAGTLEISEAERKAISWGLPISSKQRKNANLPLADFRKLINHHLESTEWKYQTNTQSLPVPGWQSGHGHSDGLPLGMMLDGHPIRALGKGWIEKDEWLDPPSDSSTVDANGLSGQEQSAT
ncbi:uncharacterized protein I206_101506 [Kwoniella pini CBS 10737]|uniref:Uncharacterized protein n=1 Tax=Kwoniella pini CBS 10737 TaxID=1296096 RepID=A0A1B9HWJ9_9TREE|nr:uncharacterized protein I206_06521 [Kwoniella pini CBS 10737]OCF47618.1 hypothetical protein I206_06521 [Kwoniella pini CBS 10737]